MRSLNRRRLLQDPRSVLSQCLCKCLLRVEGGLDGGANRCERVVRDVRDGLVVVEGRRGVEDGEGGESGGGEEGGGGRDEKGRVLEQMDKRRAYAQHDDVMLTLSRELGRREDGSRMDRLSLCLDARADDARCAILLL